MKYFAVLVSSSILFIVLSCSKDKTPAPPKPCDPSKVYFEKDILPILNSSCAMSGCHDVATSADGYQFTTYDGVMDAIKKGNPSDSKLYKAITETDLSDIMPPPPNVALSSENILKIRTWIEQGASNETCDNSSACDTGTVTYSTTIATIMSTNCIGCHNASSASGGFNLSSYAGVKSAVDASKLYESVSQNGAAASMPPSYKLSTCDINRIKAWIDAGAPNN